MHIPNSNLTAGKVNLSPTGLQAIYNEAEVVITGNPTIVASPVGNATRLTPADRVQYLFPASAPWPCPFDINKCPSGITMSLWFRWEYFAIVPRHRWFISLGSSMYLYRPNKVYSNLLSLRWVVDTRTLLYGGFHVTPGEWTHMLWVVNTTHYAFYINGLKVITRTALSKRFARGLGRKLSLNEALDMGTFSVGQINLWAGRRSPVFMWRLYQDGLRSHDGYWIAYRFWSTITLKISYVCSVWQSSNKSLATVKLFVIYNVRYIMICHVSFRKIHRNFYKCH